MKSKRVKIVIALGSNVDQEAHILKAKKWLEATFEDMTFGTSLWTEPIGLSSDKFLNTLGVGYTNVNMERTLLANKSISTAIIPFLLSATLLPHLRSMFLIQNACMKRIGTEVM